MRPGELKVTSLYTSGGSDIRLPVNVHHVDGEMSLVELREPNSGTFSQEWMRSVEKGEVLRVPTTSIRFTD